MTHRHILSFDVEDWYQGFLSRRIDGWQGYPSCEKENIERILMLLDRFQTKATFFVLGRYAEEEPAVVSRIARAGHEVATHGYAHLPLTSMSPSEFRSDLHRSIDVLQSILGEKIAGHRATGWSLTKECSWAPAIMAEMGLRYDSSIFPTRIHKFGLPSSPIHPYRIPIDSERSLVEFPAQVLTIGPVRVPASGGFYLRALPLAFSVAALQQSERRGHAGMVYLHPYDLDAAIPRIRVPLGFRIVRYYHLARTEEYLVSLLSRFSFACIRDFLASPSEQFPIHQPL